MTSFCPSVTLFYDVIFLVLYINMFALSFVISIFWDCMMAKKTFSYPDDGLTLEDRVSTVKQPRFQGFFLGARFGDGEVLGMKMTVKIKNFKSWKSGK